MRYCPHCHRLNPGRPIICHFCGRTWRVRLCPRGHANPFNAQYCGTCGSMDLSDTAGPRLWWPYPVKALIVVIVCIAIILLARSFLLFVDMGDALIFGLLLAGYLIGVSILPRPIKSIFTHVNHLFLRGMRKVTIWVGRGIKEFFNLILNW